jgi:hypothetical protein
MAVGVGHRREGATGREEGFAVGPGAKVLGGGFGEVGGVAEGEDDGARHVGAHFVDGGAGKGVSLGGGSDEHVGFDACNNGGKAFGVFVLPFRSWVSVGSLGSGEVAAVAIEEKSCFVDAPVLVN